MCERLCNSCTGTPRTSHTALKFCTLHSSGWRLWKMSVSPPADWDVGHCLHWTFIPLFQTVCVVFWYNIVTLGQEGLSHFHTKLKELHDALLWRPTSLRYSSQLLAKARSVKCISIIRVHFLVRTLIVLSTTSTPPIWQLYSRTILGGEIVTYRFSFLSHRWQVSSGCVAWTADINTGLLSYHFAAHISPSPAVTCAEVPLPASFTVLSVGSFCTAAATRFFLTAPRTPASSSFLPHLGWLWRTNRSTLLYPEAEFDRDDQRPSFPNPDPVVPQYPLCSWRRNMLKK